MEIQNNVADLVDDWFAMRRNQSITITAADLLHNDADPDHDALAVTISVNPAHGTQTQTSSGVWNYAPNTNYIGTDTFQYVVDDGASTSSAATVEIEVKNSAPQGGDDRFLIPHDRLFSTTTPEILENDYDADGDTLTAALVTGVSHGTLTFNSNATFTYVPAAGYVGTDSFEYRTSDGASQSNISLVTFDVQNNAPQIHDQYHRMKHDQVLTVDATSGLRYYAVDPDSDVITPLILVNPAHGTLNVAADGSWVYTPNAAFIGKDSFTWRASDGVEQSDPAIVTIEVTNTDVVTSPDYYTLNSDQTLTVAAPGVLKNDFNLDQDPLTLTVVNGVEHGSLTISDNGSFTYSPTTGFAGEDQFTYKISDGVSQSFAKVTLQVGRSTSGTTQFSVRPDHFSVNALRTLVVATNAGVVANDSYKTTGAAPTVQLVTGPSHGTLALTSSGSFTYTPSAGATPFTGTDSFVYRLTDSAGQTATATAQIDVRNHAPSSIGVLLEVHQGNTLGAAASQLAAATSDAEGHALTYSLLASPTHGTLTFNADGHFVYAPATGYSGLDSFTWRAHDGITYGNTSTVTLNVTNKRPTLISNSYRTNSGQQLVIGGNGVLSTASDADGDTLNVALVQPTQHGTLAIAADGTFTYTPDAGFSGRDTFRAKVFDGAANSSDVVFSIDVENSLPVATGSNATLRHGTSSTLNMAAYDSDGDSLVYELTVAPEHGTLTYANLISNGSNGTPIRFTGSVSYTPSVTYAGKDELTFRVTDGVGFSESATISINVLNSKPTGREAYHAIDAGTSLAVAAPGLLGQALDADGDPMTLQIVTQPSHGTLALTQTSGTPNGGFTYQPTAGFAGVDTFTWRVSDGVVWSDPVTETIAVNNSAPVLRDRSFHSTYSQGTAVNSSTRQYHYDLATLNTAFDLDSDPVTFQIVTNAAHGTAIMTAAGAITYTPTSSTYIGNDEFTVRGFDGYSWSEPSKVAITIDNETPLAIGDSFTVHHGTSVSFTAADLLGNDYDFDGDTMHIVSIANGTHGTLSQNGTTWTFNPGTFIGTTELTYIVSDGLVNSESATIEIEVTNAVAWAVPGTSSTGTNGAATIQLLGTQGGVSNPDGDTLSVVMVSGPTHGTLTTNADGSVTYVRFQGYTGADSFSYRLSDGVSQSEPIVRDIDAVDPSLGFSVGNVFGFASDGMPGSMSEFDFTINLQNVDVTYHDSAPTAVNDQSYLFNHGWLFSTSELNMPNPRQNDYDPDGDIMATIPFSYDGGGGPGSIGFTYTATAAGVSGNSASVSAHVLNLPPGKTMYQPHMKSTGPGLWNVVGGEPEGDGFVNDITSDSPRISIMPYMGFWGATYIGFDPAGLVLMTSEDTGSGTPMPVYHTFIVSVPWMVTDQYGSASGGVVNFAATEDPDFRWNILEAAGDEGSWYGPPSTGNVLANDYSADNDVLHVSGYTIDPTSAGGALTIAADGNYTFSPDDPYEFAEKGFRATYTVEDTHANSSSAVLAIGLLGLKVGQGVGYLGTGVLNGEKYDGPGLYNNGLDTIGVWIGGDGAHLYQQPNSVNKITVTGGAGNVEAGLSHQLWLKADGSVAIKNDASTRHAILTSINGDISGVQVETARLNAAGDIGDITATQVFYANAGGDIGTVTAGKNVYLVSAGGDVGQVTASDGYVVSVTAGQDIAGVTASKWINTVSAGRDIAGEIKASDGGIGIDGGGGLHGVGGISAGRNIPGDISATAAITQVTAGQNISGTVKTTGGTTSHIYLVTATAGNITNEIHAGGSIGRVQAGTNIAGEIKGQNIGLVKAGRIISGNIDAELNIGAVSAGTNLTGDVEAELNIVSIAAGTVTIANMYSGSIDNTKISAGGSIGSVTATQTVGSTDISGGKIKSSEGIKATGGYIGTVTAARSIEAEVKASGKITTVAVGTFIMGNITSETATIGTVSAGTGRIEGEIKADKNIGTVTAYTDRLGKTTSTTGSILSVIATQGVIFGDVRAAAGLGKVSSGSDMTGNIEVSGGSLGHVEIGTSAGGNLVGNVTASMFADAIDVYGIVNGERGHSQLALPDDFWSPGWNPGADDDVNTSLPRPTLTLTIVKGNLMGNIQAGTGLGYVAVDGILKGNVTSDGSLNDVTALKGITGNITSQIGATIVTTFGALTGDVSTVGGAGVFAFDEIVGDVTASSGRASISTWSSFTGEARGGKGIGVSAWNNVTSDNIESSSGSASVSGGAKVQAHIEAALDAHAVARSQLDVGSGMKSHFGSAFVASIGDILGSISAHMDVMAVGTGKLQAEILSEISVAKVQFFESVVDSTIIGGGVAGQSAGFNYSLLNPGYDFSEAPEDRGSVFLVVQGAIENSSIISRTGSAFVDTGSMSNSKIRALEGSAILLSYGDVEGRVIARNNVFVTSLGSVTDGNFESLTGDVFVTILAPLETASNVLLKANGGSDSNISLVAWGPVEGSLTTVGGDINAVVYGKLDASVTAAGMATVYAWGELTKDVSGESGVLVFARHTISGKITSTAGSVVAVSGGSITEKISALGGKAQVYAFDNVTKDIDAKTGITVQAMNITGDLTSDSGDIEALTIDDFAGNATTAGSVSIIAGKSIVDDANFSAGGGVDIRSIAGIVGATINAGGRVIVSSTESVTNVNVESARSVGISGLTGVTSLQVSADRNVLIYSGAGMQGTVTSREGSIDVIALGNIDGTFTGETDVYLTTFESASGITVTSNSGTASVFAVGSLSGTITGVTEANALTLGSFSGTLTADVVVVFAGESVDGTFNAAKEADITAGKGISGQITSRGSVSVLAAGIASSPPNTPTSTNTFIAGAGVSATVSGYGRVSVSALGGAITGAVTSHKGNASAFAATSIDSLVKAADTATATAVDNISGGVEGAGLATATTRSSITSTVKSILGASVAVAGKDISGSVEAAKSAVAISTDGRITGGVASSSGDVVAFGLKGISGSLEAAGSAVALSLGSISGDVHAISGSATVISIGGAVSGGVSAGESVTVVGFDAVSSSVSAGTDAVVVSITSVDGGVQAGGSITVMSLGNLTATLDAGTSISVVGFGDTVVQAEANESVVIISPSGVSGSINAGTWAAVVSGTFSEINATTSEDFYYMSMAEWSKVTATADGDVFVWTAGALDGNLTADGDVVAIVMGSASGQFDAGGSAFVIGFEWLHVNVNAGEDAIAITLGMATKAVLDAGRDAYLFAFGPAVQPVVQGDRYAGLVSWDSAVPNALVNGPEGAFAWTYGEFHGLVQSTAGSAGLVALGGSTFGGVIASEYAWAISGGDFSATVSAGKSALVVSLASMTVSVTAGDDIVLLAEGSITASANAGRDMAILAYGDVRGGYVADRDAWLFTYGGYDASLYTYRDIFFVYAVGDIVGPITALGDIGTDSYEWQAAQGSGNGIYRSVFSHGRIISAISAGPYGGHIGSVGAWGPIDGDISASVSIGGIESADEVNANISAPQMGSVIEFSPALIASTPIPPTPDSVRAAVLAEAAAIRALLEADRDDIAAKIDEMKLEFTLARIDAQRTIGEARSEAASEIAEALRDADTAWQKSYDEARTGLSEARNGMVESLTAIRAMAISIRNAMHEEDLAARERAIAAREEVLADHDAVEDALNAMNLILSSAKSTAVANRQTALIERKTEWDEFKKKYKARLEQLLAAHLREQAFKAFQARIDNDSITGRSRDWFKENGIDIDEWKFENEQWGQKALTAFAEVLPGTGTILDAFKAVSGTDINGNKVGKGERALAILTTGLSVLGLGAADDFGGGIADGAKAGRQARAGRRMEKIGDVIDDTSDMARGARRAGDQAADKFDDFNDLGRSARKAGGGGGGCFRPGTSVHKLTPDEALAIAALLNADDDQFEASSISWWIYAAVSAGLVLTALHLERKRQQQRIAGPMELASSALDELFTSDTPWEPALLPCH